MHPGNRYNRKTLGQLLRAKLVLVAVCRRCRHEHVLFPAALIERFGKHTPALDIRPLCAAASATMAVPPCTKRAVSPKFPVSR